MPSTTGSVSRARPMRRATISAREGSPRRAGSVADISTPMKVPCSASRRRALRQVGAALRIACQARPRTNIERHISAKPAAISPGLEATRLAATRAEADALQRDQRQAEAGERDARRAPRAARLRSAPPGPGAGERGLEARQPLRGHAREQVGGREPVAHGERAAARVGARPTARAPARRPRAPQRRRAARRSARRARARRAAISARRRGSSASRRSASASASASPRGVEHAVEAVAHDVAIAGDVRGHDRRAGGEGLGQDHAEALAAQRGRAQHVGARELGGLALLGDLARARAPRGRRAAAARPPPARPRPASASPGRARAAPRRRAAAPAGPCARRPGR